MAVAVAHAFMRTFRGRASPSPPAYSRSSSSSPPAALPSGLVYEAHDDPDVPITSSTSSYARRRSSTTHIETSSTSSALTTSQHPPPEATYPLDDRPLSISTAVVGLVAASHRTFHDVQDINFAPRAATASLQKLQNALKSFKLTVQLLYKWLRRFERRALPYEDRAGMVEVDTLIVMIAEAADALSEAGNLLVAVVRGATTTATRISDVVPEYAASILNVSERLERVDHLISKLLTILQISSLSEAMSVRSAIDVAIPLIMAENASLAESIRAMPDVFSACALVPAARLASILDRPPPSYSNPQHSSETLPDYSAATASNTHPDGSVTIRPLGWSVFASLTLADVSLLSLIPLPFCCAELRYGALYTEAYAQRVDPQLAELMELHTKSKAARLASILGSRSEAVAMSDNENFARRVGYEVENEMLRDGRLRPRIQPNLIVGALG